MIKAGVARFWAQFPDSFAAIATEQVVIEKLLWTSLVLASVCFVIEMLLRNDSHPSSPFDRLAESPERARRFIWLVLGFVVVCSDRDTHLDRGQPGPLATAGGRRPHAAKRLGQLMKRLIACEQRP